MAWFNFLKSEGFFNPDNNLEPILVKDGYQIPYWEALTYLEKLSIAISNGKEVELAGEIIKIIVEVSNNPKDNYRTWYAFIKILANLPNERIPITIFNYIPLWLSGKFDTMIQTSEICDKLLPKFLNEQPTPDDIAKAELILSCLFQIKKIEKPEVDIWRRPSCSYSSIAHLHFLSNSFEGQYLAPKIIKYCSTDFILELGKTLRTLLLDYPSGIGTIIKNGEVEYTVTVTIDSENLLISTALKDSDEETKEVLSNYLNLQEAELREMVIAILKEQGVNYIPINDINDLFEKLKFSIHNDIFSTMGFNPINKLGDRFHNDEKVLNVFSFVFRNLIIELAHQKPEESRVILKKLWFDRKYNLPFFKRVCLYVIGEFWDKLKDIFFELIEDNDKALIFSNHVYYKELYGLLVRNQNQLNDGEIQLIQTIIEKGEQVNDGEVQSDKIEYWQLRWYSALKGIMPFKENYLTLSKQLNLDSEHYENLGEIKVRQGSISPLSGSELLEKTNEWIVEYLMSFRQKDIWQEPNIGGLSEALKNAVSDNPDFFLHEIDLYREIPYTYFSSIIFGLTEAWSKHKSFDWESLLSYCLSYITNEKFKRGEFQNPDENWDANPNRAAYSIANLLIVGLKNDNNAFETTLLPITKEIINKLAIKLEAETSLDALNSDYVHNVLNSKTGRVLTALIEYSLRRARTLFKYEDTGKWEEEQQHIFEQVLEKGIVDAYVLMGKYFEQFYFLDNDWISKQVKLLYKIEDKRLIAFINGFALSSPPFNKDVYDLFYPHYFKIISEEIEVSTFWNNALIRHLTAFYFWGYEDIADEKLLYNFLNKANANHILEFINFIWRQEDYPNTLNNIDKIHFNEIIMKLWSYLVDKFENKVNEEEQKVLASLSHFIVFVKELDTTNTSLLLKSCKYLGQEFLTYGFLEKLVLLKNQGNPFETAKFIGQLILPIDFKEYMGNHDEAFLKELIEFLFKYKQKEVANEFCNKVAIKQQDFLKDTYRKYNQQAPN